MDTINSEQVLSPKTTAATLAGAVTIIIGVILAHNLPRTVTEAEASALTGAIGTLITFAFAWMIRDPLRSTPVVATDRPA